MALAHRARTEDEKPVKEGSTRKNLQSPEPSPSPPPTETQTCSVSPEPDQFDSKVRKFLQASIAANTRRAYQHDLDHFLAWGGRLPASPETVAKYLADHAGALCTATLARRTVAIGRAHILRGFPNPAANDLVRITLRGIRRTYGRPQDRVTALTKEHLVAITSSLGNSARDIRDRALLLIGFAGAFRRSELIAVDCNSIERRSAGIVISISRSKTDQERRGRQIAIPRSGGCICPIAALDAWLEFANISEGPIFRSVTRRGAVLPCRLSAEAVALIVKARSRSIAPKGARYSGHSLRAGFVTSAAIAGVPVWKIKTQTGHTSEAALGRYIRNCELFAENPVSAVL
jgi:integrase